MMRGGATICSIIGRYQEYLVQRLVHLKPGVLEERDVNPMLEDIDRRMGECLAKPLPTGPAAGQ